MFSKKASSFLLIFMVVTSVTAQQNSSISPDTPTQSNTEDLSRGATFKFEIAPDLPEFTFKIIPMLSPMVNGNHNATVGEVQVFLGDSTQPLQSLDDFGFKGMEAPYRGADWFRAVDINFDGYKDIYMMTSWGVTGNESGCVWLYDSHARRFEFSKDFSAIGKFILDPATNTITTGGVGGHAGKIFRMIKYIIEDNRPVPIFDVLQTWDTERNKYHCVVKQRQSDDNVLGIVRDVWGDVGNLDEAPCNASDPLFLIQ